MLDKLDSMTVNVCMCMQRLAKCPPTATHWLCVAVGDKKKNPLKTWISVLKKAIEKV